jgi:GNAT superfamily N-acetyltransferase
MYEGVFFELTVTHGLLVGSVIELTWIIVPNRKQGVSTSIMRELCEFADRHTTEVRLKPASKEDNAATTSRPGLIRFYRRFGFVRDSKPAERTIIPNLVRKPGI